MDSVSAMKQTLAAEIKRLDEQRGQLASALRLLDGRDVVAAKASNGHGAKRMRRWPRGSLATDILAALATVESMRHRELYKLLGRNPSMALANMIQRGQVQKIGVGVYQLVRTTHVDAHDSGQTAIQ